MAIVAVVVVVGLFDLGWVLRFVNVVGCGFFFQLCFFLGGVGECGFVPVVAVSVVVAVVVGGRCCGSGGGGCAVVAGVIAVDDGRH